ncbi:MAG TPA: hypothetical protein DCP28_33740 [Cytophagales bacterium]|nr:hypothetical protein [Cytophagales bacterium]
MKLNIFLTLLVFLPAYTHGQGGNYVAGARAGGLSHATTTLADGYAFFHNPAGLAQIKTWQMMGSYAYRVGWEGTQTIGAAAVTRWKGLGIGVGAWRFGDQLYSEQWAGIAVGYQMGLAALGGKVSWLQYHIEGVGNRHLPLVELGGWAALTPQFQVGGHVTNVLLAKLSPNTGERVPTLLKLGIAYLPLPTLTLLAEAHQSTQGSTFVILGVEYEIISKLWLRAGSQLTHRNFSGGLGYQWRSWQVAYSAQSYFPTGWNHQLSISRIWPVRSSQ